MQLLELLGRRWVLRLLWELRDGEVGFRALQKQCDEMSPSTLSQRLDELKEARLVESSDTGVVLTARGRELVALLLPISDWARRWATSR
jgi:DNA-binding HxlR family transcriptional regulator